MTYARAMMRVLYAHVEDYLDMGWYAPIPTHTDYMHHFGVYMFWLCDCQIPTRKKDPHQ